MIASSLTEESGGVIVLTAPGEQGYRTLLKRLDAEIFRAEQSERLPLLHKRKLHVHVDWQGDTVRP